MAADVSITGLTLLIMSSKFQPVKQVQEATYDDHYIQIKQAIPVSQAALSTESGLQCLQ